LPILKSNANETNEQDYLLLSEATNSNPSNTQLKSESVESLPNHNQKEEKTSTFEIFNLIHSQIKSINMESPANEIEPINWLSLPDELWLKVIGYLKQSDLVHFGLTCKRFNKLYADSSLCNITFYFILFLELNISKKISQ
jgi:hypothetical protein